MSNLPKVKAAIFDFDGTLANSMWVWDEVDHDFAVKRNLPLGDEHAEIIAALGFEGTAEYLLKEFGLHESVDDLIAEWHSLAYEKYAHEVGLKPGALEFMNKLRGEGLKIAIATSLQRVLLEPALKNNGILDAFDTICICDEICEGGKSTPAVYQEAARRLGVELGDCVVFEDVAKAARSAKAGGAYVVGVRDDRAQQIRDELITASDLFIDSFEVLL